MLKKRLLAITLILTTLLAMSTTLMRPAGATEYVGEDCCWIEGENLDIGFSMYGEMISYDEDSGIGLGLQYPGYSETGSYDQDVTEEVSVDPFCNEKIEADLWINGWFIDIKYLRVGAAETTWREIWAFALFSDGTLHGHDWITMPEVEEDDKARPLWQEYPPYANPDSDLYPAPKPAYGGRKTNGACETDPITVVYNGPRKFVALLKTRIKDGVTDLVDVIFTIIFNKAEKNVIILKDIKRLYAKRPMNICFGNRGEWDLSPPAYVHFYTDEPVQAWDVNDDGDIDPIDEGHESFYQYFRENKHPQKWWDEVPEDERPTLEGEPLPDEYFEAQYTPYSSEDHTDETIKDHSYAVAQVVDTDADWVGAMAVWPHPEFWSVDYVFSNPKTPPAWVPLMFKPLTRCIEWNRWTVQTDPEQGSIDDPDGILPDREDVWIKLDDGYWEPGIPWIVYEHDFKLEMHVMDEYRIESVYMLTDRHDADDADAGLWEPWSSGLNVIDSEIQYQLGEIFGARASPVASFTYEPSTPYVGEAVIFNATASYDPDRAIINYDWDFGDGTTSTGMTVTHIYTTVGTYNVTLTVTDNDGLTGITSQPITIGKVISTISISASPSTITIEESTTINGSITPTRVGVTVTISYRMIGESWDSLATVITDENSQYSHTWTPSEIGTYEVKASWLGDENTLAAESSIVTIAVIPPRILSIRLSGEHDYLFMEGVKIRLAALVKDAATMEPISNANVTIEIYDPNGNLWVSDMMVERLAGTGIYEWESEETIRKLRLEKGVYLAYVSASSRGRLTTSDILEFHIDPPAEDPVQLHLTLLFTLATALAIAISVWYVDHRRLSRKLSELPGKIH